MCLVSMGNCLKTEVLEDALISDALNENSKHDFGHNIIPNLVKQGCIVKVYDFAKNKIPRRSHPCQTLLERCWNSREALPSKYGITKSPTLFKYVQ